MTETSVDIDGGFATVRPATPEVARRLLEAADNRWQVQTTTRGGSIAFLAPESVAASAGLIHGGSAPEGNEGGGSGADKEPAGPVAPNKGSSRATWVDFLAEQGIEHDPDLTRNELADLWESRA